MDSRVKSNLNGVRITYSIAVYSAGAKVNSQLHVVISTCCVLCNMFTEGRDQ